MITPVVAPDRCPEVAPGTRSPRRRSLGAVRIVRGVLALRRPPGVGSGVAGEGIGGPAGDVVPRNARGRRRREVVGASITPRFGSFLAESWVSLPMVADEPRRYTA